MTPTIETAIFGGLMLIGGIAIGYRQGYRSGWCNGCGDEDRDPINPDMEAHDDGR